MASYIACNQMGKIIDYHKESSDTWPLVRYFPNKEHVKLNDSPYKAFEINCLIVLKKDEIKDFKDIKIYGKSQVSIKCFENGKLAQDKGGNLITEMFQMNLGIDSTISNEADTKIETEYMAEDNIERSKLDISIQDYEVTSWKRPQKIAYNSDYVILFRKAKQIIKNWADQFSSLEFEQKADYNFDLVPGEKLESEMDTIEDMDNIDDCPETTKQADKPSSLEASDEVFYMFLKIQLSILIKCCTPMLRPKHKLLNITPNIADQNINVISQGVRWNMQQNNQNVKIPFNNQDGLGYTVNAQCINKECPGSDKISWFSANLNSNLSIPASVDVAIFINVRANYTSKFLNNYYRSKY